MSQEQLEYSLGNRETTIAWVQEQVELAWRLLQEGNPELAANARVAGIDVASLPANRQEVLMVGSTAAGFDPSVVDVLVTLAGTQVAQDLWNFVILPWLRRRYGDQVLVDKDRS